MRSATEYQVHPTGRVGRVAVLSFALGGVIGGAAGYLLGAR